MPTQILTRQSKGSRLTMAEMDANFVALRDAVNSASGASVSAAASAAQAADSASLALQYTTAAEAFKNNAQSYSQAAAASAYSASVDKVQVASDRAVVEGALNSVTTLANEANTSASSAASSAAQAASASRLGVGTVTTGAAGSSVQVTITGAAGSQVLNLVIPRGNTGLKGDKGDVGLKGDKGDQGLKGDTGATGASMVIVGQLSSSSLLPPSGSLGQCYLILGNLWAWNGASWIDAGSIVGPKGDKGDPGSQGLSAYQVALANGFSGTESQWLASLVGQKGDTGDTGVGISSVTKTNGTGAPGTVDTYTISLTNGATSTFTVYNGADGSGSGDMSKSVYDTDGDGVVDAAESVPWSGVNDKPTTFAPSAHSHATADVTGLDTALAGKISSTEKGSANGVAPLGADSKIAAAYLPSYVDDVLEYANQAAFPATGETGKIYTALDTNKIYRWSGSIYVEISASPGSSDSVTEGSTNLYFTAGRVLAVVLSGLSTTTNAAITSADSVLSALGKLQKQITDFIAQKGASNGLASLDASGKLTSTQIPTNAAKTDAAQTFSAKQVFAAAVQEAKATMAAANIDLATANYFTKTISGAATLTVSNVPSSGTVASFILELTNGGSATVNWFSGVKWAGGTAPTLTAAGVDILGFYTLDGGTTWRGLVLAKDSK